MGRKSDDVRSRLMKRLTAARPRAQQWCGLHILLDVRTHHLGKASCKTF